MDEKLRERLPIIEWPDQERRMAIMARMTSDPPLEKVQEDILDERIPDFRD